MAEILGAYLSALWTDWVARLSGLASVLFTVGGVFSDVFNGIPGATHARHFWGVAAVGFFLYANFRLWAKEHRKVISQTPKFTFILEHVDWEYQSNANETAIIIAVTMMNSGYPSAAQHWTGNFYVGDFPEKMKGLHITKGWMLPDPAGKNPIMVLPEHQLYIKTGQGRIETGAVVTGRAFFSMPGDKTKLLHSLNWRIDISCMDCFGHSFTGEFKPGPGAVMERKAFGDELPATKELLASIGWDDETAIPRRPRGKRKV